jgi:exodeoxyribonuclease V beta subunit
MRQGQQLDVLTLPLSGQHLIEASAGTGKTFNITRLYLRILLQKELTVQQILVMTFTNAATEEIRGRIAQTLREAQRYWQLRMAGDDKVKQDPVYSGLFEITEPQTSLAKITAALLELDEAAVFTIHGFCHSVLGQLAFSSGTPMNMALVTDTSEMYTLAAQDWVRLCAKNNDSYALLEALGWHDPEKFIGTFNSAIHSGLGPKVLSAEELAKDAELSLRNEALAFEARFTAALDSLIQAQGVIFADLIDSHKEKNRRTDEWHELIHWLQQKALVKPDKIVGDFLNGNRYRTKPESKTLLVPVALLRKDINKKVDDLENATQKRSEQAIAYALAADGIRYIREHVSKQKRQQGVVDFDDLIHLLADNIKQPSDPVCVKLRTLFPVALVDEFQDTDAQQYHILKNVYDSSPAANGDANVLMMIGDPKQAIYGFRGGDIFTYLEAASMADHHWVMDTNWRSVAPMVDAYNRLFFGAPMDDSPADVFGFGIHYEPVKSTNNAKAAAHPLVDPASSRRALNYVYFPLNEDDTSPAKNILQRQLSQWVSNEIGRLLNEAALGEEPLQPADIAILVRNGREAHMLKTVLAKAGLNAVYLSNRRSLFASEEALDVLRVLNAIWYCDQAAKVKSALGSPLLGLNHEQLMGLLYQDDDSAWDALNERLFELRQLWVQRGCMSLILVLLQHYYQPHNQNTERSLTNYQHLAEILESVDKGLSLPYQVLLWLHHQIIDPSPAKEQIQRLESDGKLIQIVTQHGSKGLEYPIVFVPFASEYKDPTRFGNKSIQQCRFYDDTQRQQVLQLGVSEGALQRVKAEGDAESMRLLYVAVTRASHRCYLGIIPTDDAKNSALGHALGIADNTLWEDNITQIINEGDAHTQMILMDHENNHAQVYHQELHTEELCCGEFRGNIDDYWRLYSFSALSRQQQVVKTTQRETELELMDAEQESIAHLDLDNSEQAFRFSLARGASAGNLLHDVLEHIDFNQPDWLLDAKPIAQHHGLAEDDFEPLTLWLTEVLNTPLCGADSTTLCLADLTANQTLKEAEFYFPLAASAPYKIMQLLQNHRQQLVELTGQAHPVPRLTMSDLQGMMHGFIDLIFCYQGRYYVADYKSTHLGNEQGSYTPAALAINNQHHLYDLQYLIYSVALHRYLQQRLPNYDPEAHFGGVYYLYLRGMSPRFNPGTGVFFHALKSHMVDELAQILDDNLAEVTHV